MRMGDTDAECTHACIEEHGGTYVLVDAEHVYQLERSEGDQGVRRQEGEGRRDAGRENQHHHRRVNHSLVTAVRFIVMRMPGLGSSCTPMTVRAGRWLPILST